MRYDYTLADVLSYVESEIKVSGNFSTAEETHLKRLINTVHTEICSEIQLKTLKKETTITTTSNYTTGTLTATNDSTTLTGSGTTWTALMVGRKIRINGESTYYTITGFTSTTSITIDRAYTGTTASSLTYSIFRLGYDMPRDFVQGRESLVRYLDDVNIWEYVIWNDVAYADPAIQDFGTPYVYTLLPDYEYREPSSSTNTADSGTSTTSVVDSSLVSSTDDYYNNWILVNTTRGDTSLVTDYVGSTKTLTCSPAITGQTTGDSYYLVDKRIQLCPWPVRNGASSIFIEYFRQPTYLSNNYDIPDIPQEAGGEIILVAGTLGYYYGKDPLGDRWRLTYEKNKKALMSWNSKFINMSARKEQYSFGAKPELRIPYSVPTS